MAYDKLKVWSSEEVEDPVKGNTQLMEIREEEWLQGWGRESGVTAQHLNTLFRIISEYSPPSE